MGWYLWRYLTREHLRLDVLHAYGMDTIPAVVLGRRYGHPVATFNGYWATCPFWDHTDPVTHEAHARCGYRRIGDCVGRRDKGRSWVRRVVKWHVLFLSRMFRQYYARRLDLLLCVSQSMREILAANGFSHDRMRVCYNMVDVDAYKHLDPNYLHRRYSIPSSRRILLHAGRFAPYKGSGAILQAAPAIVARHPDVHFVFAGQGSTLSKLKAQTAMLGLDDRVTFAGFVDPREMPNVYASARIVLHTATWPEPFARGPIEAMAAGVAVVATATGGTPEAVFDEETGLLIPPFDPEAIATACNRLLCDASLRNRVAEGGRALVRRTYCIEAQIGAFEKAYASIL